MLSNTCLLPACVVPVLYEVSQALPPALSETCREAKARSQAGCGSLALLSEERAKKTLFGLSCERSLGKLLRNLFGTMSLHAVWLSYAGLTLTHIMQAEQ
ncbi:hypothetical protein CgunFtcFv8_000129 [Champsocephalus gunnari]|uniref:Uncharacterized protein n=1 Tax=Champsocephalus gunnari TaxID=52237 RepID=A0AAN8DHW6_CHAGU|nr:hypothetical protein CgunFtcFv8_000129 [Champsocephalus gunnari]